MMTALILLREYFYKLNIQAFVINYLLQYKVALSTSGIEAAVLQCLCFTKAVNRLKIIKSKISKTNRFAWNQLQTSSGKIAPVACFRRQLTVTKIVYKLTLRIFNPILHGLFQVGSTRGGGGTNCLFL